MWVIVEALRKLADDSISIGDYDQAKALFEDSRLAGHEVGDVWSIGWTLNGLAVIHAVEGRLEIANDQWHECLAIFRDLGDRTRIAGMIMNLGWLAIVQGDYERARQLIAECMIIEKEIGNRWGIASLQGNLGYLEHKVGNNDLASKLLAESLIEMVSLGRMYSIAEALLVMALVACATSRLPRAARLFGAAEALREVIDEKLIPYQQREMEDYVAKARAELGEQPWDGAWGEGRTMSMEQAIEYALEEYVDGQQ